ncbi:MAG: RNA polymerase sigma factor [Hyphomonadaceae bacterium]|nr:MAG: RNA polymerase sigma-70 factor ECF subfamily [Caulobacteraceae bacterium]MBT9445831.1 RNA polymerase sigma factor [Hyphomonadaceae bacterium]TPW05049.1 MAG: RNA polymerase sigma-70 factor, ECF subfamily [Alphaproteobacteria bacterium]
MAAQNVVRTDYGAQEETELVQKARAGDREAFGAIMRRGSQRLFRVARSIMKDDAEAEDVVQEAYVRAFANLDAFRGDASIFTWLTRITINEANGRLRKRRNVVGMEQVEAAQGSGAHVIMFPNAGPAMSPEEDAARMQVRRLIETAIDDLPETFRTVFVLRDIEECSVAETAQSLDLREETVKTRLHRARRMLRAALNETLASTMADAFPFLGQRCERIKENVLARLALAPQPPLD